MTSPDVVTSWPTCEKCVNTLLRPSGKSGSDFSAEASNAARISLFCFTLTHPVASATIAPTRVKSLHMAGGEEGSCMDVLIHKHQLIREQQDLRELFPWAEAGLLDGLGRPGKTSFGAPFGCGFGGRFGGFGNQLDYRRPMERVE